jgi:hypothetical protein
VSTPSDQVDLVTVAERPDLADAVHTFDDPTVAPFLYRDPISYALLPDLVARCPRYTLLALAPGVAEPVGMIVSLPFTGDPDALPGTGYDGVALAAAADVLAGRRGNLAAALLATVRPGRRDRGLSALLLTGARDNARRLGHDALFVPARPTRKHEHPHMPMAEYADRTRDDGTAEDPWLRTHLRLGGERVGICHSAMTITGTLAEWREWTGLPFDTDGPVVVPGGLVPVHCDLAHGTATYVEPNVWFRHPT